jgi:hypothetical protein
LTASPASFLVTSAFSETNATNSSFFITFSLYESV